MSQRKTPSFSPAVRVLISLVLPIVGAILYANFVGRSASVPMDSRFGLGLQLVGVGLISWFLGLRWYGLKEIGLRGRRPLYAGIGFASLGWVAFLLVRFLTVEVQNYGAVDGARTFVYLLLFEALCVQVWAFGTFFRSVADWRGPLTAAIASGLLFGAAASRFFLESFGDIGLLYLYFFAWGILYGVIRLRTGSLIGTVIVQALHSWTGWQLLRPYEPPVAGQLINLYLISSILYIIIIWRLWPKQEEDYRV